MLLNENVLRSQIDAKLSRYIKQINTLNSKSKPYKNITATLTDDCVDIDIIEILTEIMCSITRHFHAGFQRGHVQIIIYMGMVGCIMTRNNTDRNMRIFLGMDCLHSFFHNKREPPDSRTPALKYGYIIPYLIQKINGNCKKIM